jgi:hypothetical protein
VLEFGDAACDFGAWVSSRPQPEADGRENALRALFLALSLYNETIVAITERDIQTREIHDP